MRGFIRMSDNGSGTGDRARQRPAACPSDLKVPKPDDAVGTIARSAFFIAADDDDFRLRRWNLPAQQFEPVGGIAGRPIAWRDTDFRAEGPRQASRNVDHRFQASG